MLKTSAAVIALLLVATPTVAAGSRDLARCKIEAERIYPNIDNRGIDNWPERLSILERQGEMIETCMRAAGYILAKECQHDFFKDHKECMKTVDESIPKAPESFNAYEFCRNQSLGVRAEGQIMQSCYRSDTW